MRITITFIVVSDVINIKPQHHCVVFVNNVVAVHRITSGEVSETEVNTGIIILAEPDDILTTPFDQCRSVAVAAENLVLFEVNVYWVRPVESTFKVPDLCRVALNSETDVITVEEFVVDDPLPVTAIKLEAPLDALSYSRGHLIERRVSRGIDAVIGHGIRDHSELEHFSALSRWKNVGCWSCTVTLFQTVFEVNDAACGER